MNSPATPPAGAVRHDAPFVIVMNAGSGKQDTDETRELIASVLSEAGREYQVLDIDDPTRIADVASEAVNRAQQCGGVVVAAGGDGTLNAVARVVIGSGLAFGVLPQGTFNYFARAHGIPQDSEASVRALLRARPQPVQVGRVNGELFLVSASVGLYTTLIEDREAQKRLFGRSRWVAMWSGLLTLLREPRELRLQLESEQAERRLRTPTLLISNSSLQLERIGVAQAEAVARNRGQLAAIVVRPTSSWGLLGLALRGALGRLGEATNVDTFAFRKLIVDPVGHRRIKVAIDGEIRLLPTPLTFEVASEPLLLLIPASDDRVEVE